MIIQETTKMSEREKMAARNSNFCYLLNALYPVGSIYVSKDPTDPAELFGGSWKRIKERFIWAIGDNENPGDTGGEKTHTLTEAELPKLSGSILNFALQEQGQSVSASGVFSTRQSQEWATYGSNGKIQDSDIVDFSAGSGQAHNNMPPWEGFYIWERIESDVPMGGSAGMLLADQTYNPESANAQSGIAVAQAVETCSPAIITTSDTAKAFAVNDSSESVIKGLTAYGESTQDGTPTPDSPVEIVSVENPTITIAGKNLLDLHDRTDAKPTGNWPISKYDTGNVIYRGFAYSGYYQLSEGSKSDVTVDGNTVTFTQKANGYGIGYVVRCYPNTNYYFSGTLSCDVFCAIFIDTDGNKISDTFFRKFTTPQNARYVILSFSNNNTTGTYTITNPQLEIGSAATSYEPYNGEQTVTIPYTFRGLKNTNGDWAARDELRVGEGKVEIVRNVGIIELKGTEVFTMTGSSSDYKLFYTAVSNYQRYYGLCNYYKVVASGAIAEQCYLSDRLYFGDSRFTEVADFKNWLSTQYSAGNPVVYYYNFETAAVEDITATEAGQALLALKTNYPNTSVISDIDLDITYKADTKNYIDNKIAERLSTIETAILNNV